MRIQFMTGDVRLIRFPIERRLAPSEEMLHDISPDPREICQFVEAFQLEPLELGIQDRAGKEMASYLVQFSDGDPRRGAALAALKGELLREAVAVCADAAQASDLAGEAAQKLHDASMAGGSYLRVFQERATRLTLAGAKAMVRAHIAVERALGALRAIRLTAEGKDWTEFSANDVMEELMRVHQAAG